MHVGSLASLASRHAVTGAAFITPVRAHIANDSTWRRSFTGGYGASCRWTWGTRLGRVNAVDPAHRHPAAAVGGRLTVQRSAGRGRTAASALTRPTAAGRRGSSTLRKCGPARRHGRAGQAGGVLFPGYHAALDGKGGTVLANAILDLARHPREVPPPTRHGAARHRATRKIGETLAPSSAIRSRSTCAGPRLPSAASSIGGTMARQSVKGGGTGAPACGRVRPLRWRRAMFNTGITPGRVFATISLPADTVKPWPKAVGGSFNDIVLWLCVPRRPAAPGAQHGSIPRKPPSRSHAGLAAQGEQQEN